MPEPRIKTEQGEILLTKAVTTIGRTQDNDILFASDSNVSRFHAEIEFRDGDHYLIDLNSSNGTTVNDEKLVGEHRLANGDKLMFGGSSTAEFLSNATTSKTESPSDAPDISPITNEASNAASEAVSAAVAATPSGSNPMLLVAGAVCGLAVICAVAAGAFYATRGGSCSATAEFVKPERGDSISSATDIEIKVSGGECVAQAVYMIDEKRVATGSSPSFGASLDPAEVPEFADGLDHSLKVQLVDAEGNVAFTSQPLSLAFDTAKLTPKPTPVVGPTAEQPKQPAANAEVSMLQMQEMATKFAEQFSGGFQYNISNKQFLTEVKKRSAEFAQAGIADRAAVYRDAINTAFVREQNLDAALGFILALERSKFVSAKQGTDEGLWRMSNSFVVDNKYNGQCGTETLSDASQNCAARAAAIYMKAIVFGVFDGDSIYGAVAFGKSPQDAATWKASFAANRTDVWNTIKTAPERERLVRFFAAGIVAENPQRFGLSKDRPLSTLYPAAIK
ncbi:MAG TPA: FHA domain-containing protein [Pyrinomonadaceae bacterium]|nr:FHA domain-containing protein [Pyrinomonadaceae bacterium]